MEVKGDDMSRNVDCEYSAWLGLKGHVCVVTGGGGGIGAETARQLASAGAHVAILDVDETAAKRIASEIVAKGGQAISIGVDVACVDTISSAADEIGRTLGLCSVLVNNAAVRHAESLMTLGIDVWNKTLAVNLTGPLICAKLFGQQMIKGRHGGSIVNVASVCGLSPRPNSGAYSVTKAGMIMLSSQLAVELAAHQIRSNVVAPGFVNTQSSEKTYQDPESERKRRMLVPSGRIGHAIDIANTIVFLSSHRSSYINGQTIVVDGGFNQTLMSQVDR
jgi:NAD(P)-dependent dehydrogenase (short-subunit alcohol dehydrogenase family)